MWRMAGLALIFLCAGCASPTVAFCDDWSRRWCERLWLCLTEHSLADPAFVAEHGASLDQCAAIHAAGCAGASPCLSTDATTNCLAATTRGECAALQMTRLACVKSCGP
jgi:hypothetical protein